MFTKHNHRRSSLILIAALGASACLAQNAEAAKQRVYGPIFNADVAGTNANQFYGELINTDLFYSWSGTHLDGNTLFTGRNNDGQNRFTAPFDMNRTLGSNVPMMFDTIRDKDGKITRKPGPGVIKPSTLQIKGPPVSDVVTSIDPLGKTVRRAVPGLTESSSDDLEVVLTNETDSSIYISSMALRVNNTDDPLDFDSPFIPDGTLAALDESFVPQSLSPGATLIYTYSGQWDENLAVSVEATSLAGSYSFAGGTGEYLNVSVPEPGMIGLTALAMVPLMARVRRK